MTSAPGSIRWAGRREIGSDTAAVLGNLGFDEGAIDDLIERGIVKCSDPGNPD